MLSAYIDGELSLQDKEALEKHLAACDSCRDALSELIAVRAALQAVPEEELPSGLHEMIMGSLPPHRVGLVDRLSRRFSTWTMRQWAPAMAAAMVLVILISSGGGVWYANRKLGLDITGKPLAAKVDETTESRGKTPYGIVSSNKSAAPNAPAADYGTGGGQGPAAAPPGMGGDTASAGLKGMLTAQGTPTDGNTVLLDSERKIIQRAQLSLEVTRGAVRQTSEQAINAIKANFGYIESSSIAESEQGDKDLTSFYMMARVPADKLEVTVQTLSAMGRATRQDTSAQDVTDQYVDLDARLRNKENQEQRLLTIMGEAQSVGELLQVEGELSRVRGDIESMKAQKMYFDKSVSMSTVSLTLTEEGAIKPPSPSPWGDVWRAFLNAWRTLLLVVAKAEPALITLAVVAGIVALVLRRRRTA
jgi:hypothetical protein